MVRPNPPNPPLATPLVCVCVCVWGGGGGGEAPLAPPLDPPLISLTQVQPIKVISSGVGTIRTKEGMFSTYNTCTYVQYTHTIQYNTIINYDNVGALKWRAVIEIGYSSYMHATQEPSCRTRKVLGLIPSVRFPVKHFFLLPFFLSPLLLFFMLALQTKQATDFVLGM